MRSLNQIARTLSGRTRLEERAELASADTYTIIGVATSDSENGSVRIRLTDSVTRAGWDEEGTDIEVPTNGHVREGQRVYVTCFGGSMQEMVVSGAVGEGDELRADVNTALSEAEIAHEAADAAVEDAGLAKQAAQQAAGSAESAATSAANAASSASNAEADARRAEQSATSAQSSASTAATAASNAQTSAGQAASSASAAAQSASDAQGSAATAASAAQQATQDAAEALRQSGLAQTAADTAIEQSGRAETAARQATSHANSALVQLSTVEDVMGVLDWVTAHGTYVKTTDTAIDATKVYYVLGSDNLYHAVAEPDVADISTYYELSIDQALSNFVASHLALTDQGLYVLKDSSSYKTLLSDTGMTVYDPTGNAVATYGESTTFATDRDWTVGSSQAFIFYDASENTLQIGGANVQIGGLAPSELAGSRIWTATADPTTPNYTFARSALTGASGAPRVGDLVVRGYYRYTVSSVASSTVLTGNRTSIRGATGPQGPQGPQGEQGPQGAAGHSPEVTSTKNADGSVTILVDGTATSTVDAGEDGHSPTVTTTKNADGSVTIYVDGTASSTVEAGTDGTSYYTYVRYSKNANGSGMVATPTAETKYIGVYTGTSSSVPAYTSFNWSKYVGDDAAPLTVTATSVDYILSTSGTNPPADSASWQASPLAPTTTQYLWTRTTLTFSDGTTAKSYSVGGKAGTNGAAAYNYELSCNPAAISKSKSGTLSPASVTFSATRAQGTGTPAAYAGRFVIAEHDGSSWASKYTSSANESSKAYTPTSTAKVVRCTLYLAGGTSTQLDVQSVPVVSDGADGADAYTVMLTNESHTFAAGSTAAVAGSATSRVIAYKGATQVAATIGSVTGAPTGMSVTLTNNGTTSAGFTVSVTTSLTTQAGTLSVPVTVDGKSFALTFSWALAKTGSTGPAGPEAYVTITPSSIDWTAGTATLTATLHVDGAKVTSGVTYAWAKGDTALSTTTASCGITDLNATYSCTCTWSGNKQRGTIDFAASNSVKLLAEAGFETAERTYSTKSELEVVQDAITLSAQKADRLLTLVPMRHTRDDTWFWYSLPATQWTYLDDGWAHYEYTNSTSSAVSTYIAPKSWGQVIPGEQYTFLVEIKNYSGYSGTGQFAYMQEMAGAQFHGTGVVSANGAVKSTRISYNDFDEDGAFTKRFVKLADTDHIGDGTTYDGMCFRYRFYIAANTTLSFDMRISVYPGDYEGPYNEYLTAAAGAQFKVASDAISARVEKNGVIAAINASVEEEGGSAVKIQAKHVEIDGTAIFNNTNFQSNLTTKLDSIKVGGTNLLRGTCTGEGWGYTSFDKETRTFTRSTTATGESYIFCESRPYLMYELGTEYVLSCWAKSNGQVKDMDIFTYDQNTKNIKSRTCSVTTEWTYFIFPFKYDAWSTSSATPTGFLVRFDNNGSKTSGTEAILYVRDVKLERGNKATNWSPAPEDTVARTQRIYYRKGSAGAPSAPSTWVTNGNNGENNYNQWTTKVPPIASGTGANVDKYAYLYTCEQYQMADGTLDHTTILLDENTTIIDGGTVITGSLSANSINASSGTFDAANIPNLNASKINAGDIAAARIKTHVIEAINSLTAGKIDADRINVDEISIGQSQVDGLENDFEEMSGNLLGNTRNSAWTEQNVATASNTYGDVTPYNTMSVSRSVEAYDDDSNAVVINNDTATGNRGVGWFTKKGAVKAGTKYTFSCMVWASRAVTVQTRTGYRSSETSSYAGWTGYGSKSIAASTWTEYSCTLTPASSANLTWEYIAAICFTGNASGVTFKVAHAKLEFGDTATPWDIRISDAAKTATTYLTDGGSNGLMVHPSNDANTGVQITDKIDIKTANKVMNRIDTSGMTLYDGNGVADGNIVAKFASSLIELGKNSRDAVINMCNDVFSIAFKQSTEAAGFTHGLISSLFAIRVRSGTENTERQVFGSVEVRSDQSVPRAYLQSRYHVVSGGSEQYAQASVESQSTGSAAEFTTRTASLSIGDSAGFSLTTNAGNGKLTFSNSGELNIENGFLTIGGSIKAIYADSTVVELSNGKWLSLANATTVAQKLGSGASQGNTICIAQNGGYESYTGVVTGAMGSDGGARAYIYPNHTGYIRINYILIRFA